MLDQWYDLEHILSKVRADDGNAYILRQETSMPEGGAWFRFVSKKQNVNI